jgi:biopolymer transport protein ExbB
VLNRTFRLLPVVLLVVAVGIALGATVAFAADAPPALPPPAAPAAPAAPKAAPPGVAEATAVPRTADSGASMQPTSEHAPGRTLFDEINKGGPIAYVILVMSFIMLSLVIEHIVSIRQEKACPADMVNELRDYFKDNQYEEALELCNVEKNMLTSVVRAGLSRLDAGYERMQEAMQEAGEESSLTMQQKVSYLNLMGNIGPMVGLLGTVDGMVAAFGIIATQTVVKPAALAGAISEALVCTLLGLAVAIPSMCAYQFFSNRAMRVSLSTAAVATDLMEHFRPVK